ncbi:Hypothetical predicted protein, partial [Prunus dulcis]
HNLKAMRHQALSSSMEGKEARRSMSTVSLMLWNHMLVIIISDSESFEKGLPIGLIRGTQHWHQALFALRRIWQASSVRNTFSMRKELLPFNSKTLAKSMRKILWTLYAGSGTWPWIAMMKRMRRHLSRFASATSWRIIEFICKLL